MRINRVKRRSTWWQKIKFWKKEKPKRRFLWIKLCLLFGISFLGFLFIYGLFFLPDVKNAAELSFAESTIIYDRGALDPGAKPEEHILYVIHGDENRDYLPLNEISPWVPKATIAIEDDQFYSHFGFDLPALVKVFLHEAFGIGRQRGGSTITQQLAKQVFLSNERSYIRKFKELLLSIKLEWHYTKDEILELYLNKIPYGNNAFGIEAAARTYFGKSARDLSIAEASVLVSIPVAPTRFNPYGSNKDLLMGYYEYENFNTEAEARAAETTSATNIPEFGTETETSTDDSEEDDRLKVYKKGRKDLVLQRLLELEAISSDQFYQAWSEGLELEFKAGVTDIKAPHFVFYVREQLEAKYGQEFLNQGGLQIFTTLDPALQAQAEETIKVKTEGYASKYGAENVAMTSINPDNGEILAYVGGKDWFNREADGQVDVLTSRRQPGSSFKPLVYAAAFMEGYAPGTVAFDVETHFGGGYRPQNYDQKFIGPVSLRNALNRSLNIPAIKMAALAGADKVLQLADKLGIPYEGDADTHGVALGVGVAEVEPLKHITSFQAFTGDGSYYEPISILEIRNADGKVLEKVAHQDFKKEGLDPEIAALVRNILTDERSRPTTDGFDWNTFLELNKTFDSGAKTGTSNRVINNPQFNAANPESRSNQKFLTVPGDSWTIGFTPHLVTGVWVGNNRGKPMKSGATGMTVAAPVWKNFMDNAHQILVEEQGADADKKYNGTVTLKRVEINRLNGKRAVESTPEHLRVLEYYTTKNVPTALDNQATEKRINLFTGEDATDDTPEFAIRTITTLDLKSLQPQKPDWENPAQAWLKKHPIFVNSLGAEMDPSNEEEDSEDQNDWVIKDEWLAELPPAMQRRWQLLQNRATQTGQAPDWQLLNGLNPGSNDPSSASFIDDEFSFNITSPRSSVSPGQVAVNVSYSPRVQLESVEYYWDDTLIYKAVNAPFTGKFSIPTNSALGSDHTITAIATSTNFAIAEDSTKVQIASDFDGPNIIILGPLANQQLPIGAEVQIMADVQDELSGVSLVEFWFGDRKIGIDRAAPFNKTFVTPSRMGRYSVRVVATDGNGNKSEKSVPVNVSREGIIEEKNPFLSQVSKNFRTLSVTATFPNPASISQAQIVVAQPEQILYQETWDDINKFKYLYIPTQNQRGNANVQLYIKKVGESKFEKIDNQNVQL